MSTTDPIADMLTRIRNAGTARHPQVAMPTSKIRVAIAKVLKDEGFIQDYETLPGKVTSTLLRTSNIPVIVVLNRSFWA
jgi:small subunit ribosomal protein S8